MALEIEGSIIENLREYNFWGPTGYFNNTFIYTGETIDISNNNPATLTVLDEIDELMKKIKCENFHGLGTFSDYQELFRLAQLASQLDLDLSLTSLKLIAERANSIRETFEELKETFTTVLNLISVDKLIIIRNSLGAILNMLDTLENFTCIIRNQFIIKNECMVKTVSKTMDKVYKHLDCIFTHDNSQHCIPEYLLENHCSKAQVQIDRMDNYANQMLDFVESLGIDPNEYYYEQDNSCKCSYTEIISEQDDSCCKNN